MLVVAGPGNNGGDGFVAARLLAAAGRAGRPSLLLGDPARLRGDAATAFGRWTGPTLPRRAAAPDAAVIIDALFGAGLDRAVAGPAAALVAAMNASPAPVVAVDLPSGLPADTGRPLGPVVEAAATVTFFRRKPGHLLYPGRALCGRVTARRHRHPRHRPRRDRARGLREHPRALGATLYRPPAPEAHKYRRGHAVVVSGRHGPHRRRPARRRRRAPRRRRARHPRERRPTRSRSTPPT